MTTSKLEIAELINAWGFYRDQERWDELAAVFHDDGTISLSWYDGPYKGFVAASRKLAENRSTRVKHTLGVPAIRVRGARAISEVNVTIMVRAKTDLGEIDTTSYARFYDRVEQRNGTWKLVKRTAIYEKDRADPVTMPTLPEAFFQGAGAHPPELRFLAATLKRSGVELSKATVVDKSPALESLCKEGDAWLAGG
jgi:hypothetical protein